MKATGVLVLTAVLVSCGGGSPTGTGGGGGDGGGGGGGGGSTPVQTTSVTLQGSAFAPPAIRVSPGATVTWTNSDGIAHNVTFASTAITNIAAWTTGARSTTMPGGAGTYNYSCTLHSGMAGSVQVQ